MKNYIFQDIMHDKIYSRPRIKLPKIILSRKRGENKNRKKLVTIALVLLIAFLTLKTILDATLPIFNALCENRAKSIATLISNTQATNVMKNYSYDDLFKIEKDEARKY